MISSFKAFVEEQLEGLDGLCLRPMFGGHGLYAGEVFFGILFRDRLYFKTDTESRVEYLALRMQPFRPSAKQTLRSYYEVPADVLEDPERLTQWARRAIRAGRGPWRKTAGELDAI